jgi:NADPH:quinone reductase-like Zn-dependent oxidoreductase
MKAAIVTRYGGPEVIRIGELPKPVPGEREILVRVVATVATPSDVAFRSGTPFVARLFAGLFRPRIAVMGDGIAGIVEAVGPGTARFRVGDRVFGSTGPGLGAYAEYRCLPEDAALAPLPEGLGFGEAAGLSDGMLTALPFLRDVAALKPGQRLVVNGASGSVGSAAVQLGRQMGAIVTGVCSGRNIETVTALGAHEVIDYKREDFTARRAGWDVIFDAVGKSSFARCAPALTTEGLYLTTVPDLRMLPAMLRKRGRRGRFAATGLRPSTDKSRDLAHLMGLYDAGSIRPLVDRRYPLEQIAAAHAYVETGRKVGSVVIDIHSEAPGA